MVTNGYVPTTQLTTISPGFQLLNPVAQAFKGLRAAGKLHGVVIRPVDNYGSGYRSYQQQTVFWQASQGNRVAAAMANLDPDLNVNIARPGYSSHGTATRADLLFNNHSPDAANLALAHKYGFFREFGTADTNHFKHDLRTAINGYRTDDKTRIVATYLNSRRLGKQTGADKDGKPEPIYWWLVQEAGRIDKIYKGIVDGKPYTLTWATETHYYLALRDAA